MSLITGETVEVIRPHITVDELGEPVTTVDIRERVDNVVVSPKTTSDLGADRPNGVRFDVELGFPKGFSKDLTGCRVVVRGIEYEVVGHPVSYVEQNTPGEWNLTAEAVRVDG